MSDLKKHRGDRRKTIKVVSIQLLMPNELRRHLREMLNPDVRGHGRWLSEEVKE